MFRASRKPRRRRPPPEAIDEHTQRGALRTIAAFEALKGSLVLLAGFGMLALLHKDAYEVADHLLRVLHFRPESHAAEVFLRAADKVTDAKLWAAAAGAMAYSTVRFVEAYGLWHSRVWAEWFALLSGTLYLPWELYELLSRPTPVRWIILVTNLGIVLYMLYIRLSAARALPD